MKKILAMVLAGAMLMGSMTAFAAGSPSACTATPVAPAVTIAVAATPVTAASATAQSLSAEVGCEVTEGEVINNASNTVAGIPAATVEPIAIGKGCVINGVKTNFTPIIVKAAPAIVKDVKNAVSEGTLVNVVTFKNLPKTGEIQTSIYSKNVKVGDSIVVYQKINGVWTKIEASVRTQHIDVKLQGNGPIAVFRVA